MTDDVKGRLISMAIGTSMSVAGAAVTWGVGAALLTAGLCVFASMVCLELANLAMKP